MNVREWIEKNRKASSAVAVILVLVCVGVVVFEAVGHRHTISTTGPSHYYTIDDGKTFFVASGLNIAPFPFKGTTAVRAYVYECGGNKFVGYLQRYTPAARKIVTSGKAIPITVQAYGRELKRPGTTQWVSTRNSAAASKIKNVTCPQGTGGSPNPIEPD